ncbi:MAG: hypothetical protein HZB84_06875 [Deltaproteobacteria bacterium]|nr:hypothetical protein [Deltaproteobacteria bacterium]
MKRKLLALMLGLGLIYPVAAGAEVKDALLQKLVEKGTLSAQEAEAIESRKVELPAALKGLSIGGVAFFDYSFGQTGGATKTNYNRFTLQRGYLNVVDEVTPWLKVRITPDIKSSSTATGDYTVRMKYLYADLSAQDFGPLTNNALRVGLEHTPFLDFEESMNGYRMQGSMFQDKRGLITSSDPGVSVLGNFGGKLSREQVDEVGNSSYSGRYGTYHIGLYNGGGYGSTTENNQNKSVEGRLTVRPLPDMLPGLQLTYFGVSGKGDANESATGRAQTWTNNTGLLSYQYKYLTASAEYYAGKGSFGGDTTSAKEKNGYSLFGKFTVPMYDRVALFVRYDTLDPNKDVSNDKIRTTIGGVSYKIHGNNYLVAAYEKTHDQTKTVDDKKGQVVLQLAF